LRVKNRGSTNDTSFIRDPLLPYIEMLALMIKKNSWLKIVIFLIKKSIVWILMFANVNIQLFFIELLKTENYQLELRNRL